jgi:hypothetical protein
VKNVRKAIRTGKRTTGCVRLRAELTSGLLDSQTPQQGQQKGREANPMGSPATGKMDRLPRVKRYADHESIPLRSQTIFNVNLGKRSLHNDD